MSSKFKVQSSKFKIQIFFLCIFALVFSLSACSGNPPSADVQTNNTNPQTANTNPPVVSSHGGDYPKPQNNTNNSNKGNMGGGGSPIDTTKYDADIKTAEAKYNKSKTDDATKKALAQAYFDRGLALTEVRQYRSALGDYRRTLKYDPNHAEAKEWVGRIVYILKQMKREVPKEGEEPPPLPYKKS